MPGLNHSNIPRYIWTQYSDKQQVVQLEQFHLSIATASLTPFTSLENMLEAKQLKDLAWIRMPLKNTFGPYDSMSNLFTLTSAVVSGGYFNPMFYFARAHDGPFVNGEIIPQLIDLLSGKVNDTLFRVGAKPMEKWYFYICGRKTQELKMPLPAVRKQIPIYPT